MVVSKNTFEELTITRQFIKAIEDQEFRHPTEIQVKAIPLLLAGNDVIGIAQTGTGKTAAFSLPILMKLKFAQGADPRALILAPTKELVIQIGEHIGKLSTYCDLRTTCLFGGIGPKNQIKALEEGTDIIVSTPGRFIELYKKGVINCKTIKTMVMDEADKLMDMGFMPQIRQLLEIIPAKKRQNMLFSATFPEKVETLAEEFLEFPNRIEVAPQATPTASINQYFYHTPNFKSKIDLLSSLLQDLETYNKVIVFVNTKKSADDIMKFIERKMEGGAKVIHSNKGQNARINAINEFREGQIRVLVATDVSARGIDVPKVSHVINFEIPMSRYEDYVHRIGRTGRAYEVGEAISFLNKAERMHFKYIEKLMKLKVKEAPLPSDITIEETPKEEIITNERIIDTLKRMENPDYQGAFHQKKRLLKNGNKKSASSKGANSRNRNRRKK